MNELQPSALGHPGDLAIVNGTVILPELGDTRTRDIVIKNDRIAALPESATIGDETTVIDATDAYVVPGFVDAHTHVDVGITPTQTYHYSLLGGTTTIVTESSSLGAAFGPEAVEELLKIDDSLPLAIRPTIPPQPLYDTFEPARATDEEAEALASLLGNERVVGVGEVGWIHVVGADVPVESLFTRAREEGVPITGHGAGARDEKLAAFATVVDDDHEAITPDGVVSRVEQGLHVIGRAGSVRDDMAAFATAADQLGQSELSLCSDGVWPRDLIEGEHMNAVVRRAIEEGVGPVDAIRMATLNSARHFGMTDRGSLSPGSIADVVILSDLESVTVRDVIANGELVVQDGEPLVGPREHDFPDRFAEGIAFDPTPEEFQVPESEAHDGRVRAIENSDGLLTGETTVEPPVEDGHLVAAPENDLLLASLHNRHPGPVRNGTEDSHPRGFTGFLTGFGLTAGAVATTITWEVPGLLAVGATPEEMALAAQRVVQLGGGWAVVHDEEVVAELPAPIAGVLADAPLPEAVDRETAIEDGLRELGCDLDRPLLTLQTMSFPGVPRLKLSFSGYADVVGQQIIGLSSE